MFYISLIFDFPNLWTLSRGYEAAEKYILSEGTHYRDYTHFDSCSLSRIKGSDNDVYLTVGAEPICIDCGEYHMIEDNISCCEAGRVCEKCGRRIRCEDDEYWVGDYCYCEDCVSYCECCQQYELSDNMIWVKSENQYICDYCIGEYYYRCEHCGEYYYRDNITYVESNDADVCSDCLEELYMRCDNCGEYFLKEELQEYEGYDYCQDCYNEAQEEEEEEE